MTEHTSTTKVVVVGGGYAGTLAANRLQTREDVEITLVNPRPQFVERIRLHQLVAGTGAAAQDFGAMLGARVRLIVDSVTRIDTAARSVRLASDRTLRYDYLIYAVGSTAATPASIPGAAEFAYPLGEWEHAQRLRAAIGALPRDARITVVGGGPTGIETAAELAEQGRTVTLTNQLSHRDDRPRTLYLGGRVAAFLKESVCKATVSGIRKEGRKPGSCATITGSGARLERPAPAPDMVSNL
ncbi:hypothetical protein GCM10027088_70620 [Nocardia goodfellowii]|uniref:NADH dehydrogenase FAD-containing subunit n=1 Tax=Nocardia goodfellowii TaxID=882446 RepID=A0ABS4QLZ3_9NOCA|nr:NADH dehydrogenase FAD-containing subunit [Nocardia goodfellowii]